MKHRLDSILVARGLAPSRTLAQAMIMAGEVSALSKVLLKPGQLVDPEIELTILKKNRYASRGGDKLASVAETLKLNFKDKIVLDVGSSTGGFTDFALVNGAAHVYAVDVGSGQLAYRLRQDPRVTVMERTDIRSVSADQLNPRPNMAIIDVSFISLIKILPSVVALLMPSSLIIAMAKPQFESDKATADRHKGVIKDEEVRQQVLDKFEKSVKNLGLSIKDSADSLVYGAKGNHERFYLIQLKR